MRTKSPEIRFEGLVSRSSDVHFEGLVSRSRKVFFGTPDSDCKAYQVPGGVSDSVVEIVTELPEVGEEKLYILVDYTDGYSGEIVISMNSEIFNYTEMYKNTSLGYLVYVSEEPLEYLENLPESYQNKQNIFLVAKVDGEYKNYLSVLEGEIEKTSFEIIYNESDIGSKDISILLTKNRPTFHYYIYKEGWHELSNS